MKNYVSIFIVLISIFYCSHLGAQVTIGLGESPEKGTLLQLKEKNNITDDAKNAYRGLGLPRVTLSKKDQLYPMFLSDPENPDSGPNTDYDNASKKADQDKKHTGMIVYNLVEDAGQDLCKGLNQWNGTEWGCFEARRGQAVFTITDCSTDIKVYGDYGNNSALGSSNFITISVVVTKPGAYSIAATVSDPADDNGYFFLTSGEFLSSGTYSLVIPGMGTPVNHQTDYFTVSINGVRQNGSNPPCTFQIEVKDTSIRPKYTMSCGLTQVFGEYYEEKALDATNYIEVSLNIESGSAGASYEIETNEVDGIKFKGSGILGLASPQVVKLYGEGVPFDNRDKKLYIKTNSESSTATCVAEVVIVIPPKKTLCIGYTATTYGYNWAQVGSTSAISVVGKVTKSNWMVTDPMNFGPNKNSIVRYSGFVNKSNTDINHNDNRIIPVNNTDNFYLREQGYYNYAVKDDEFRKDVLGHNDISGMDVIIIGWTEEHGWMITQEQANTLKEFCEKGGVLLVFNESTYLNEILLRTFFNKADIAITSNTTTNPAGAIYKFVDNPTDPILNGPFGNISSLYWGEDASYTRWASNLPYEDLVLYSSNKNVKDSRSVHDDGAATAFRHRTLPFVWVGDGGFTSGSINEVDVTSTTICPFLIGVKTINGNSYVNYPIPKDNFGCTVPAPYGSATAGGYKVFNSVFAANALAWCITTAEELKRTLGN